MVFVHNASLKTVELLKINDYNIAVVKAVPKGNEEGGKMMVVVEVVYYLRRQLQEMMSDLVSIVRSNDRLALAKKKQQEIFEDVNELYSYSILSPKLSELRNLTNISYLIIKHSLLMTENKGAFFNKDLA